MSASQTLPSDPIDLLLLRCDGGGVPAHPAVRRPSALDPRALEVAMEAGKSIMLVAQSPPARMIPLPKTSTKSAASPASCRC